MNYRHAYHAGNFADVFKHALLCNILGYLLRKETGFRYLDTHAGIGLYDLGAGEAEKTGEWRNGIGRLIGTQLPAAVAPLLAPYLAGVRAAQRTSDAEFGFYPGSPWLARAMARPQDRLTLVEKHPADAATLKRRFARDERVATVALDGWTALNAYVPPRERRGLVLVDPPFEEPDEFARMTSGLAKAHAKWPGGIYALWYPIKDPGRIEHFAAGLVETGIRRILRLELFVHAADDPSRLNGCGLIVVNPPFTLAEEAGVLLPYLAELLVQRGRPRWSATWLVSE
jgi:23S rRNA (adenine2030-N6)-methyltransferase